MSVDIVPGECSSGNQDTVRNRQPRRGAYEYAQDRCVSGEELVDDLRAGLGLEIHEHGEGYRASQCPLCGSGTGFNIPAAGGFYQCFACGESGFSVEDLTLQITQSDSGPDPGHSGCDDDGASRTPQSHDLGTSDQADDDDLGTPTDGHSQEPTRIQQLKNEAAAFFHRVLHKNWHKVHYELESGNSISTYEYLVEQHGHSKETLTQFKVGLSNGKFCQFARERGYIDEELISAGLLSKKSGRDYWPVKCVLFPHLESGEVSHSSQKDPGGKHDFQSKKAHRNPVCLFFNQDATTDAEKLIIVEGENDLLSIVGKADYERVIACNGSISKAQITFLRGLPDLERLILCFDNDEAGETFTEKVGKAFRDRQVDVVAIQLPDGTKDIDELLCRASDPQVAFGQLLRNVRPVASGVKIVVDEARCRYLHAGTMVQGDKVVPIETPITNYLIEIVYRVRTHEGCERHVRFRNFAGETTDVFEMPSTAMASPGEFRKYALSKGNFLFIGSQIQLNDLWEFHFDQDEGKEIFEPTHVGYVEQHRCWLFGDLVVKGHKVYEPDSQGIVWVGDQGFRPRGSTGRNDETYELPQVTVLKHAEAEELLDRVLQLLKTNLGYQGWLVVGWVFALLHSKEIFSRLKCFPGLFLYGRFQGGKNTLAGWIMSFFGLSTQPSKSFSESTQTAINRLFAVNSSMPVWLDEFRHTSQRDRWKYGSS